MNFSNTKVMNFKNAITGMRNPKNSWDKSDSFFGLIDVENLGIEYDVVEAYMKKNHPDLLSHGQLYYDSKELNDEFEEIDNWLIKTGILQLDNDDFPTFVEAAFIGPDDMRLAQQLIKAGSEHRKFMRQIFVSVDITAPIYWWKEASTYKVGTTANSTSTMHKLASTPITLECFEIDDYKKEYTSYKDSSDFTATLIDYLESLRLKYNETKDINYWKELIRWLPESWLQTRTWTCNYEVLLNICRQRKNHKLSEWKSFIDWVADLPYANELIFINT